MKKLRALLIDPFQRRVHELAVSARLSQWYNLLDCDCVDRAVIGLVDNKPVDVWVNESGLLAEPYYPLWRWVGAPQLYPDPLCGYGLVLSHAEDELASSDLPVVFVLQQLVFEPWEQRLDPQEYFDQLSRIYLN